MTPEASKRLAALGDSPRDQIEKIKIRINVLRETPYESLPSRAKVRLNDYRSAIEDLQRQVYGKDLTYLEQLRAEVDEFCLVKDMRGWDKCKPKKPEELYFIPQGAKLTLEPINYLGRIIYDPRFTGKIMAVSA